MKIDRVYVDAEGVVEDGHGNRFEDQSAIIKKLLNYRALPPGFYTTEPIQVELVYTQWCDKSTGECHRCEYIQGTHGAQDCKHPTIRVARIVTEEEKPQPTINDTYWTAMLTLSARIPKGASLLLAYETDQAICVTNSKTPEHHSCTEMGCINDSHVIYRLPKVKYAPKAPLDQPSTPEEKEKAFEGIEPGLLDKPIRFPQPAPVVTLTNCVSYGPGGVEDGISLHAPVVDKPDFERIAASKAFEIWVNKYPTLNPENWPDEISGYTKAFVEGAKYANHQQPTEWIPVSERPLYITTEKGWEVTEDGEGEFWAAVPLKDGTWWIKHCVVEDEVGLCVVCNDDNEPAGFALEDVTHFIPISLPEPPKP